MNKIKIFSVVLLSAVIINALAVPVYADAGGVSINGRVCTDLNRNGSCEKDEPGVPGIRVDASSAYPGYVGGSDVTDNEGKYQIGGLTKDRQYLMSADHEGAPEFAHMETAPSNGCNLHVAPKMAYMPLAHSNE